MNKLWALIAILLSFTSTSCMESQEEITVIPGSCYQHEDLVQHMTQCISYLEYFRVHKTSHATLKELTRSNNEIWYELNVLHKAIKTRDIDEITKSLKEYNKATKRQHQLFAQGIEMLEADQTLEFKNTIKSNLTEKATQKFFEKKICNKLATNENSWLKIRIYALNLVRQKLKTKNTTEKIADMADEIAPCSLGGACGIGLVTLFTSLWPWGAAAIALSSCVCLGCHQEMYTDCRPSTLWYADSKEKIDRILNREIESLLLREDSPRDKKEHQKKEREKQELLKH